MTYTNHDAAVYSPKSILVGTVVLIHLHFYSYGQAPEFILFVPSYFLLGGGGSSLFLISASVRIFLACKYLIASL